jgi:hypothetical protein
MSKKSSNGARAFGVGALIAVTTLFALLNAANAVVATNQGGSPASSKGRKESACKGDIQRYCSEANLKQECLVARWDKISVECRNVLGTSAGSHGSGS